MKRIIQITLFVVFLIAVSGLMGFIYFEQSNLPLNNVLININRDSDAGFLNSELIKTLLNLCS